MKAAASEVKLCTVKEGVEKHQSYKKLVIQMETVRCICVNRIGVIFVRIIRVTQIRNIRETYMRHHGIESFPRGQEAPAKRRDTPVTKIQKLSKNRPITLFKVLMAILLTLLSGSFKHF